MAGPLEIGNGWQSPRISFTFDFLQTENESNTNDWQSPRISFSLNLSQTKAGISPEKRKRADVAEVNYDTDFEFCVINNNNNNGGNSITGETLLPIADELFVDGKILPLIHGPDEAQPVTIARHLSLERSRCQSLVRSTSSKITSSCWGKVASKYLSHRHPKKWKEIMFKLNTKEDDRAENRRTSSKLVDQDRSGDNVKQLTSCKISMWPFSRICSTGDGQMEGNDLLCSLPCSRIPSTTEHNYKAVISGCPSKETETLPGLVKSSKPLEARSISNNVQSDPRCLGELKPGFDPEDGKEETKAKQTPVRGELSSPEIPASRVRGGMSSEPSTKSLGGNGRLMVRNLQRSSSTIVKTACLDSRRPGKPMAEGSILLKANKSKEGGGVRVSPVLNLPVCISIGYVGGRCGGLFGFFSKRDFFSKREKKYHHHHTHASTNRKKGM